MNTTDRDAERINDAINFQGLFAQQFNLIPDDTPRFLPDADRFLWGEYETVLTTPILANTSLSPDQEQKLAEARAIVTETQNVDGVDTDILSAKAKAYYQYKEAYELTYRVYLDEKITVESSSGPEGDLLKQRWVAGRETELLGAIQRAEEEWMIAGYRQLIENSFAVIKDLGSRQNVHAYQARLVSDYNLSYQHMHMEGSAEFHTTYYSPYDAFRPESPWAELTLLKHELSSLAAKAPPELKALFAYDGDTDIDRVSLEYSDVPIMRPWFKPEFFSSRCWKLPDDDIISDGKIPCSGKIPAYISSIVVARKITVTKPAPGDQRRPDLAPPGKYRILGNESVDKIRATALAKLLVHAGPASTRRTIDVVRPAARVGAHIPMTMPRPMGAAAARPMLTNNQLNTNRNIAKAKFEGTTIATRFSDMIRIKGNAVGGKPSQQMVTESFGFDGVVVVALVCRRVPKAPNPDPNLDW
jgi:hypothetical protein